jgi:hypothetical protein
LILMTSFPIARASIPSANSAPLHQLAAAGTVTALADWLFYLHTPGISVAIFAIALCAAVLLTNALRARPFELATAIAILAISLLPSIEDFGILALAFAVAGTAAFALLTTGWPARGALERARDVVWLISSGPYRLAADLGAAAHQIQQRDLAKQGANWLLAWIVPLVVGAVFLLLFWQANPLIERWFTSIDASRWPHLDPVRPLFWCAAIAAIWPFLRLQLLRAPTVRDVLVTLDLVPAQAGETPPTESRAAVPEGPLFGKMAILRSLVLFNVLFAVQSALDIAYLWGGLSLPAGMSYAAYAHRGAYPLIVTALLAGAFVLAAMQPGTAVERSRVIRALVFLWVGQNVLLVISSMLRLKLYVEVYSLTGWRCAAFVWMLLVAGGLILIVIRIALDRPNSSLVSGNAALLALTLYACSLIDFPGLIADFNVAHSREMTGIGQPIDMIYLCGLGPSALPAIEALVDRAAAENRFPGADIWHCRTNMTAEHRERMRDWRAWTFRGGRLLRYLQSVKAPAASDSGQLVG